MLASWHPLALSSPSSIARPARETAPPLLISTAFTSDSYTVHLTDLTHLWTESLDRRGILKRSLNDETSIDPSEDSGQLRLLLEKLQGGIRGAGRAEADSLSLAVAGDGRSGNRTKAKGASREDELLPPSAIELRLRVELPAGFEPLLWTMQLQLQPPANMAAEFTIPLVRAQNLRMRELDQLLGVLKDKDHVIQKLVDKLEAVGAELGHVFPGAMGKGGRKISRKAAEDRVKGLGVFDKERWEAQWMEADDGTRSRDIQSVVQEVFQGRDDALQVKISNTASHHTDRDRWWLSLMHQDCQVSMHVDDSSTVVQKVAEHIQARSIDPEKELEDDDFEVQATPPHLRNDDKFQLDIRTAPTVSDSTDDEDGLDTPFQSQPSIIQDSYQPRQDVTTAPARNIGTIGRQQPTLRSSIPQQEKIELPERAGGEIEANIQDVDDRGSATASEASVDDPSASNSTANHSKQAPASAPVVSMTKPKRSGLGKIGGKKHESPPAASLHADEIMADLPVHKPKHKLGAIGHKVWSNTPTSAQKAKSQTAPLQNGGAESSQNSPLAEAPSSSRQPVPDHESTSPIPEESASEKADRKREELKRELEAKAKAPPKKKRKF